MSESIIQVAAHGKITRYAPNFRVNKALGILMIFSVDRIFSSDIGYGLGKEIEVEGWLVVSSCLTYLANSSADDSKAILVIAPDIYDQFLDQVAVLCGTMVGFEGRAIIKGNASRSGMHPLPYVLSSIKRLEFESHNGDVAKYDPPKNENEFW